MVSQPSRRRLVAAAGRPCGWRCAGDLLTRKTFSRRPAIAAPTTSSAPPSAYISAVSISVIPSSMPSRSAATSRLRSPGCSPICQVPWPMVATSWPSISVSVSHAASPVVNGRGLMPRDHSCRSSRRPPDRGSEAATAVVLVLDVDDDLSAGGLGAGTGRRDRRPPGRGSGYCRRLRRRAASADHRRCRGRSNRASAPLAPFGLA